MKPAAAAMRYFKEAHAELKKVIWPTRQETTQHTMLVIGVSIAVGILLGLSDLLFTKALQWFLTLRQ